MSVQQMISRKFHTDNATIREFMAELSGTLILISFGTGSVAQLVLSEALEGGKSSVLAVNWAWAVATMLGILVAGGVSGAHLNPAVTLALVVVGKFPWKKMFHYALAQYLGAFLGSVLVFLNYREAFHVYSDLHNGLDLKAASVFATYPAPHLSNGGGFFDQILGTALLLFCALAVTDKNNMGVKTQLVPLYMGLIVLNIGICFGFNCGYALNPARDLGPRIFTAVAGWQLKTVFPSWSWIPVVACHLGACIGGLLYVLLVENHWPKLGDVGVEKIEDKVTKGGDVKVQITQ